VIGARSPVLAGRSSIVEAWSRDQAWIASAPEVTPSSANVPSLPVRRDRRTGGVLTVRPAASSPTNASAIGAPSSLETTLPRRTAPLSITIRTVGGSRRGLHRGADVVGCGRDQIVVALGTRTENRPADRSPPPP